jgi:hypothetical protein
MQKSKSAKRPKRHRGYIIALGKDKKTIFVAGRAVAKRNPELWRRLSRTRGAIAGKTTMTFVVPDRETMMMIAGGTILWPPKVR